MQEVRANSDCLVSVFCETYYVGRHRKRFEDNIREWTGLECAKSQRAVENREIMEETGCEIICGAPMTLVVKG